MTFRGQHPFPKRGPALSRSNGFTLVELLVGVTLSAAVMAAVLSSYVYLAKNLVRLTNQQTLETEARRTLGFFAKDVQMSAGISGTPSATSVTLTIPASTGTTTVAYSYNSSTGTFTRTPAGGTAQILLRNITANGLNIYYYDTSGNIYTTYAAGSLVSAGDAWLVESDAAAAWQGQGMDGGEIERRRQGIVDRGRTQLR